MSPHTGAWIDAGKRTLASNAFGITRVYERDVSFAPLSTCVVVTRPRALVIRVRGRSESPLTTGVRPSQNLTSTRSRCRCRAYGSSGSPDTNFVGRGHLCGRASGVSRRSFSHHFFSSRILVILSQRAGSKHLSAGIVFVVVIVARAPWGSSSRARL